MTNLTNENCGVFEQRRRSVDAPWLKRLMAGVFCAALLSGCSAMNGGLGGIFGASESYTVSFCAEGKVVIPCRSLGTVSIPTGGAGLLSLVVELAGPRLAQVANLKACKFTSYAPTVVDRAVTVTASAACTLQGTEVTELVTLTLAPVAAAS